MKYVIFMLLVSLNACGGGDPVPIVSFYGDSITSGSTQSGWLNPRPVQRITELAAGRFIGVDHSVPGQSLQGADLDAIRNDTSDIVVLRFVGGTALSHPDRADEYEALLLSIIAQNKRVVLTGTPWIADPLPGIGQADSDRILADVARFDALTRAIAERTEVLFIDLRAVPFFGAADMADGVHPAQGYSDRLSAFIAAQLKTALERDGA